MTMNSHSTNDSLFLGIDVGTSGIRAVVINQRKEILFQCQQSMPLPNRKQGISEQSPNVWVETLKSVLKRLSNFHEKSRIKHAILDATSSTVLLCDNQGNQATQALMYDDKRATEQARKIKNVAPDESAAHGASSTLAKVMWLEQLQGSSNYIACHQIDYLNFFLTGKSAITDENNALKLGYDIQNHQWPNWIEELTNIQLPKVVKPATKIANIQTSLAEEYGLNPKLNFYTGTTDSIAAFLASGANKVGDVVTSLGSTLAIKFLSDKPVFKPKAGIYSHYINNMWLAGGASNAGGAVLLQHFDLAEIVEIVKTMEWQKSTGLNYYPLNSTGERFPIYDPNKSSNLSPIPKDKSQFLQGLIEGLVEIEKLGLIELEKLTLCRVKRIFTAGGGTKNQAWMALRNKSYKQIFKVKMSSAKNTDAAFGVAQYLIEKV
jgi:xylulokinase